MKNVTAEFLKPLTRLPFVRGVVVDGDLAIVTLPDGPVRYKLVFHSGAARAAFASRAKRPPQGADRWLLCADRIGESVAAELQGSSVEFLDRAGNLFLCPNDRYMAWVEGKRAARRPRARGLRGASYRVLFATLVEQFLLNGPPEGPFDVPSDPHGPPLRERPLRHVAERAGASTTAVSNLWNHLERTQALLRTSAGLVLADPDAAAETWLVGYRDLLRPRLTIGRVRMPAGGPGAMERTLDSCLGPDSWGWGALAAAGVMLGDPDAMTRGPTWTIHVSGVSELEELPFDSDRGGSALVVGVPGPLALVGRVAGHPLVHPLLIWSELRVAADPRSEEIANRFAEDWRWTWSPRQ